MGRIAAIVIGVWRYGLAVLARVRPASRRRRRARVVATPRPRIRNDVQTVLGAPRRVIAASQAAGFAARSRAWRCIGCGKVHTFSGPVRVVMASPCSCGQIEFEPRSPRIRAPYSFRVTA